jgi:GNAT superfamily N-acetyltransferase
MDLLAASLANLADAIRVMAPWQGAHAHEEHAGALFMRGATRFPTPYINTVLPLHGAVDADALSAHARAHFPDRRCIAWTRGPTDEAITERLTGEGWQPLDALPIMVVDRDLAPHTTHLTLRSVRSRADVDHLVQVEQAAYEEMGLPPPITAKLFAHRPFGPDAPDDGADLIVAYDGSTPLAAAIAITRDDVGGLYWVGTRPDARGRGAATAVTTWATRRAFERGARCVTLQASRAGQPIYERLGYRTLTHFGRMLSPPREP